MKPKNIGIVLLLAFISLFLSACEMPSVLEIDTLEADPIAQYFADVDEIPLEPIFSG